MTLPKHIQRAVYCDPGIPKYRGNLFIEALTPIMTTAQIKEGLTGKIEFDHQEAFLDGNHRADIPQKIRNKIYGTPHQGSLL